MNLFRRLFKNNKDECCVERSLISNKIITVCIDTHNFNLEIKKINNEDSFKIASLLTELKITENIKNIINTLEKKIDYVMDGEKNIYLTYPGLIKFLFIYTNTTTAINFQKWYEINITGKDLYIETLYDIFSTFTFPCIYLLCTKNYKQYDIVYKFGRTDNFIRRYKELNKLYVTTFNIIILQYIDPEYLSKAETQVHKFVMDNIIKIENHVELFTIENISPVIDLYKEIGSKYSVKNKKLQEDIEKLNYELKISEQKNKIYELKEKII